MKEAYATVNGIKLHYVEEGSGPLVILLHGFPEFWYGWRNQIPVLSKQYRVVAPDMRGYNLSDKPKKVSDYKVDILASDIAELIKVLGEEKAIVVGHDWGAAVAWAVAALHPERVKKLGILNVPHPAEMKKALMGSNWAQIKRSWYIFFFQLPWLPEQVVGNKDFFPRTFQRMCSNKNAVSTADIEEYRKAFAQPGAITAPINYYRATFRSLGSQPHMPKIKAPVLMLWGEQDTALGKELTYNTAAYCEQPPTIFYEPNSGHFVQHDNPSWVNEKLLAFFAQ